MRMTAAGRRSPRGTHKDYWVSLRADDSCPTCDVVMSAHERCRACGILVGLGHQSAHHGLCWGCLRQSRTEEGALQVREAIGRNGLCL
jgi:hypothetical protein